MLVGGLVTGGLGKKKQINKGKQSNSLLYTNGPHL